MADYTEVIRLNPKEVRARYNRAEACFANKEYDKAIADYSECLKIEIPGVPVYLRRGMAYFWKKEYERAVQDFDRAEKTCDDLELSTLYANRALMLAACADAKYRDGKKAVELATKAAKLAADNFEAHIALAAAYAETGDFAEAIRWQERAMQHPELRDDPDARRCLELYRNTKPFRQD